MIGTMFTDADGGSERQIHYPTDAGSTRRLVRERCGGARAWQRLRDHRHERRGAPPHPDPGIARARTRPFYTDAGLRRSAYWSDIADSVIVVDLATGRFSRVTASHAPVQPVGWGSDGSLYVTGVVNAAAGAAPAFDSARGAVARRELVLERIAPDGASLTRVVTFPSGCSLAAEGLGGVTIGGGGAVVACTARRYTPDVWLADRAGKSGW